MVFLPVSHLSMGSRKHSALDRLSAVAAWGVDMMGLLSASCRVARAVEARRNPEEADLKTLGIKGPLPKTW